MRNNKKPKSIAYTHENYMSTETESQVPQTLEEVEQSFAGALLHVFQHPRECSRDKLEYAASLHGNANYKIRTREHSRIEKYNAQKEKFTEWA